MRNFKVLPALLFIILLVSSKTFAQTPLSPASNISLLTCGPGDEMYSVFGHTAIRVNDPATGVDVVYNFGMFDFNTPNFYGKFVKGNLQYFVDISSYEDFIYTYQYNNREVIEQALNITLQQKQAIADELNSILLSDRKFYTYKFIHRNCTTMVADVINNHISVKISLENTDKGMTYREILYNSLTGHFFENLGISLVFGHLTDEVSEKLFLPKELMEGITNTKIQEGGSLAKSTVTVNKVSDKKTGFSFNSFFTFGVVCLLLMIVSGKKPVQQFVLASMGFLGVFFCFVSLYSSHPELKFNYNILLVNPLFLLLLYFTYTKKINAIKFTCYALLGLLAAYVLIMLNKPHLIMISPLLMLIAIIITRTMVLNRKAITKA
jgi:hypothetical protein